VVYYQSGFFQLPVMNMHLKVKKQQACKPGSVSPEGISIIYLGQLLPIASSGLPLPVFLPCRKSGRATLPF
jgi:hypothetical protein